MKIWIGLSLFIVFGSLCSNAQAVKGSGLIVTGTVTDLNVFAECDGTDGRMLIRVGLNMQFRNDGARPLIVFKRDVWSNTFARRLGNTNVIFLRGVPLKSDGQTVLRTGRVTSCREPAFYNDYGYDRFVDLINDLDHPQPTSDFLVIAPGGYYEFPEVLLLDNGYDIDVKVGKSLKEVRPRSEYPAFQIQYHLSLKGHAKGEGLLEQLRSRWTSFGDLVLDGNGDYTVTSEPIVNRSPE